MRITMMTALLAASLAAGKATAQTATATPLFGGCTTGSNQICVGADVSISLLTVNLADSNISFSTRGGPGVLVRAWSEKWYSAGVGAYLVTNVGGSAPNEIDPSLVFNFAQYLRAGVGWILREQGPGMPFLKQACILVGLGVQ